MKTYIYLSAVFLIFLGFLGCASGGGGSWSKNFALQEFGAKATDPRMNDGNSSTFAMTKPYEAESRAKVAQDESDKFTEAAITLPKAREINRIVVKGEGLEKFDVEAHSDEGWKVIKEVKDNKKDEYGFNIEITADVVRVKVPREYESREIGGQRRGRARMGAREATTGKIGEKKIYEIELYAKETSGSKPQAESK